VRSALAELTKTAVLLSEAFARQRVRIQGRAVNEYDDPAPQDDLVFFCDSGDGLPTGNGS